MTASRINSFYKAFHYKIVVLIIGILCLNQTSFAKTNIDTIVISGSVKDENGKAIENAAIIFDSTEMTTTSADGKFSFQLNDISKSSHNIYFTADGFITVIRSYNPVMGSSNYDLILRKQLGISTQTNIKVVRVIKKDTITTAVKDTIATIKKDTTVELVKPKTDTVTTSATTNQTFIELDFPSILFKPATTGLTAQDKAFLDIVAAKLKENPTVKIDIRANTHEHDDNPSLSQTRLTNIVNYLKKAGIAPVRLNKMVVPKGGDENSVDIISSKE